MERARLGRPGGRDARAPAWKHLNTLEQTRLLRTLIERITLDGKTSRVAVTFRSAGLRALRGREQA